MLCTRKRSRVLRHRSLLHVTLRNKVTVINRDMSVSDEYRFTSIIPIADCSMHFSATRFVFSQSRRYNDSTTRSYRYWQYGY